MKPSSKFLKGVAILTIAGVLSKVFGAFYRIPLTKILGAEGIGIYQMVFPIFAFVLTLAGGGVAVVASREIAALRAKGHPKQVGAQAIANIMLMLVLGIVFGVLLAMLALPIATLQGNKAMAPLYYLLSIAIFVACVGNGIKNVFVGMQEMKLPAIAQVLQQAIKLLFGLAFAYFLLRQSLLLGVIGAVAGIVVGELVSTLYLAVAYFFLAKKQKHFSFKTSAAAVKNLQQSKKRLFLMSLPVMLSLLVLPFTAAIESLLVVPMLTSAGFFVMSATAVFGIWSGVISSLVTLPSVVALAVSTAIVPSVGYEMQHNNMVAAQHAKKSIGIVWVFSLLCAAGLLVLAPQILNLLYANQLDFGGGGGGFALSTNMLRVSSALVVLLSMLQCTGAVLYAYHKTKQVAIHLAIGAAFKVACVALLVRILGINIWGTIIGSFLLFAVPLVLHLGLVRKCIGAFVSKRFLAACMANFVLTVVVGMLVVALLNNYSNLVQLLLSGMAMVISYGLVFATLIKRRQTSLPY